MYIRISLGGPRWSNALSVRGCHPLARCSVSAQSPDQNPLARVKSLKCKFTVYSVGSWKAGVPQGEVKQAQLSLDIDEIETEDGAARVTGTSGAVHVTALLTVSSLHFMERSVTGTLNVTTVFAPGGSLSAVTRRSCRTRLSADEHSWVRVRADRHAKLRNLRSRQQPCQARGPAIETRRS